MSIDRFKYNCKSFYRTCKEKFYHPIEDYFKLTKYDEGNSTIVNQKEIRVVGLRRSGNHAIINWIKQQIVGETIFINHIKPLENPYRNEYNTQTIFGYNKLAVNHPDYHSQSWWKNQKNGQFSSKDCLMYSYEDQELEKITDSSFEQKHDLYIGKSKERFDVIILRDPFNLFASRLNAKLSENHLNMLDVYSQVYSLPQLWISYAQECLSETNFLTNKKVFINYNQWFLDINYRQNIAKQLELNFNDRGFNYVSLHGNGSSFDSINYQGKASKMDVLNRWKLYQDNSIFKQLINNDRLLDYAQIIFGKNPLS